MLGSKRRLRAHKKHPDIVTNNFTLHYEDLVRRNRYLVIAILVIGLLATAVIIPYAVYHSIASNNSGAVENRAEGKDTSAPNDSLIQISPP